MNKIYKTINKLETFEFHDANIDSIQLKNNDIILKLHCVNITKKNEYNTYPTDMCLGKTNLVFQNVKKLKGLLHGHYVCDANNNIIEKIPSKELAKEELLEKLKELNNKEHYINYLKACKLQSGKQQVTITFNGYDIFDCSFSYDKSTISWNSFEKKAWYVDFNSNK